MAGIITDKVTNGFVFIPIDSKSVWAIYCTSNNLYFKKLTVKDDLTDYSSAPFTSGTEQSVSNSTYFPATSGLMKAFKINDDKYFLCILGYGSVGVTGCYISNLNGSIPTISSLTLISSSYQTLSVGKTCDITYKNNTLAICYGTTSRNDKYNFYIMAATVTDTSIGQATTKVNTNRGTLSSQRVYIHNDGSIIYFSGYEYNSNCYIDVYKYENNAVTLQNSTSVPLYQPAGMYDYDGDSFICVSNTYNDSNNYPYVSLINKNDNNTISIMNSVKIDSTVHVGGRTYELPVNGKKLIGFIQLYTSDGSWGGRVVLLNDVYLPLYQIATTKIDGITKSTIKSNECGEISILNS